MGAFELKKYLEILTEAETYRTLADAGDAYRLGNTEIWYTNEYTARDFMMGYEWLKKHDVPLDVNNLSQTHVLVGKVAETDPHEIWNMMQGETWSPHGEGRDLITKLGASHTTMSTGDIIKIGNDAVMVDRVGFVNLATGEKA